MIDDPQTIGAIGELRQELLRLGESERQVLAGPMLGSMAFELLFWLPMLRWATAQAPGLAERLTVISRGGASCWYGDLRCVDLEQLYDVPPALLLRHALAQELPHADNPLESAELHQDAVERLRIRDGLGDVETLHPWLLYRAYRAASGPKELKALQRLSPVGPPALPPLDHDLPRDFVLVNAHLGPTLPDHSAGRETLTSLAAATLERAPLVVFGGRWLADSLGGPTSHPVVVLEDIAPKDPPLRLVSAALTAARSLLGPYDGMTHLAALSGVPAAALVLGPRSMDNRLLACLRRAARAIGASEPVVGNVTKGLTPSLREQLVEELVPATDAARA